MYITPKGQRVRISFCKKGWLDKITKKVYHLHSYSVLCMLIKSNSLEISVVIISGIKCCVAHKGTNEHAVRL